MRNKYKLILGVIIIVLAFAGFFSKEQITGFVTGVDNFDSVNLDDLPKTVDRLITADTEAVADETGRAFALAQKYRVGRDDYCIRDCITSCSLDSLDYYKAYVRQYGVCMCKCLV
ncbi:hypothetical protein HOD83_01225 [Candidatus Woesearchaeota archaeon]|jgi:hypothetical protein|nr:hypothetical protein [Candidatus Woesearchaeota archaeon]MBT4248192.1 hypothetical protein [Candidatus Woesearchaeota archaeon]